MAGRPPVPGQELIQIVVEDFARNHPDQHIVQPDLGIKLVQFCGLEQGCEHRPRVGSAFVAGEQAIAVPDTNRAHLPLDHVVIDLDPPILEEEVQAAPVALRVSDMPRQI